MMSHHRECRQIGSEWKAGQFITQCNCHELLTRDLEAARETNTRLNRRLQTYEAALAEKIEKAEAQYRCLGRMLANAAATMYRERLREVKRRWEFNLAQGLPTETRYSRRTIVEEFLKDLAQIEHPVEPRCTNCRQTPGNCTCCGPLGSEEERLSGGEDV